LNLNTIQEKTPDKCTFYSMCSGPCIGSQPNQSVECNYRTQLTRRRDALSHNTRGGQLAARGPHVARHSAFSGLRKHSEKILKSAVSSSLFRWTPKFWE